MNPVVHFEMLAEDRRRMTNFYTKVFGWKPAARRRKWKLCIGYHVRL